MSNRFSENIVRNNDQQFRIQWTQREMPQLQAVAIIWVYS